MRGLDEAGKTRIRSSGVDSVFEGGYTWSSRILETLSRLDPEVAAVREPVLGKIQTEEKRALG